jgi:hypothetical protein
LRDPHFASGQEVVAVLTDQKLSETFFGEPIFVQTRSGIRYRDSAFQRLVNGENHRDICLATFAELGLPLSTPMTAVNGSFTLRDLLRDSVENFDISQQELAWTAITYGLYLGPPMRWTNRYGESFTFDDLANALMRTPLHTVSCGGAHLLYAMTILRRIDSSSPCLSQSVREVLTQYLQQQAMVAIKSQSKEGYWALDWYAKEDSQAPRISLSDTAETRLLATGHLLEWLELLPVELQPSPDVYRRAARWLGMALKIGFQGKSSDSFCPPVHAACAVRALLGEVGE